MKKKVLIITFLIISALLYYAVKIGDSYHEKMTGEVIEKYHFANYSRNYLHDDLVMVVKYPKFIITKTVDATTWYGYNYGDKITFDEKTGDNYWFVTIVILASILFGFAVIFTCEFDGHNYNKEKEKSIFKSI